MITQTLLILLQAVCAFFLGTIICDIAHLLMHLALRSKFRVIRLIGALHSPHHHFYPASLKVDESWTRQNLLLHVSSEYLFQTLTTFLCFLFLNPYAVSLALFFELSIFVIVILNKGKDHHHRLRHQLFAYRGGWFVDSNYHALHHLNPHRCFGSYLKVIDIFLGTALTLKGKQIVMTGAHGALGSALKKLLLKEGANVLSFRYGIDYTYNNYEKLRAPLKEADILLLCHGSKVENAQNANCDSFVSIIELFKTVGKKEMIPLEIWAVGSEIECHPCFGIKAIKIYASSKRNFAKYARQYYRDPNIQYRHLVHSAFISKMGPGLMTANFAATSTIFFLKRGFRYVPVTYTGFAFLNYFRFLFGI